MSTGKIVQIIGPVVDVEFPPDRLPAIYNALKIRRGSNGDSEGNHRRSCPASGRVHRARGVHATH